jgi:HAD superfamily hydrolase (TIGR01549 family)
LIRPLPHFSQTIIMNLLITLVNQSLPKQNMNYASHPNELGNLFIRFKKGQNCHPIAMKAAVFDLGHTLIDYYADWKEPERRAIARTYELATLNGCEAPPEKFQKDLALILVEGRERKERELVEIPLYSILDEVFQRFGCDVTDELIIEGMDIFYDALQEGRVLVPGTLEMLDRVRDKGYSIGLVSDVAWGLPSEYPQRDMEFFGLDAYFDDMVFSTDVGLRKPHPKMFKIALYNLGADPSESLFVGNSLQCDIKGAHGVGMTAVLKRSTHYQHDGTIVPDANVDDWSEIDRLL